MSYSRWGGSAWYAFYNVNECLSLWYDMDHVIDHTYDECLDLKVSRIMEIYGCTEAEALEAMDYVRNFIEDKVMSLDVYLMVVQPVEVFSHNITHNLGAMAREVKFDIEWTGVADLSLYDVLWRPYEHGYETASDISDLLDIGWNILLSDPEKFKKLNPENGWGSYEGLCDFVYKYRNACWDNPEAELRISR